MALTFQELGGSPREKYDSSGFTAVREFLVPWESRTEFVRAVFGTSSLTAKQTRVSYPGRKNVYAASLTFEPFDPHAVRPRELLELKDDLVDYNGSFAKAVVRYEMLDAQDRKDAAMPEDGTAITYRMVVAAENREINPTGWFWEGTGQPVGPETKLVKRIAVTEHHLTWSYVMNPPWTVISSRQGTVNAAAFLGCAPGTLLFEGGEANKLYKPGYGLDEGAARYVWQIRYVFREMSVKMGGGTYGWNHFLRTEPNGWTPVTNGQGPMYDYADFDPLFRNAMPSDVPGSH